ncbi:MAG: triose-phosphate isomerase [Lachnospiraceae bacterium]|nr:triose-phosphate isomerase [Lachnospiraceae bacterium]
MNPNCTIRAPFFEIGPKSYLYGNDVIELARAADIASEKYDVDIIFTTPLVEIARVKAATKRLHVFAPHMDPLRPGRGLADTLPESLIAAGAEGVMLNHAEKPLSISVLRETILRADELGLTTIVCADSIAEASMIARLNPNIIVAEPSELIGTGITSGPGYVEASMKAVKDVNPDIMVLQGAGISNGEDVYQTISAGAEATGSSSGVVKAANRAAMVDEMIGAVRRAWDERHTN